MQCANHPDRAAIGICVSCQKVVCASCSTRLQGRNFCRSCLERRASRSAGEVARSSDGGTRIGTALLTLIAATLLVGAATGLGFLLYLAG